MNRSELKVSLSPFWVAFYKFMGEYTRKHRSPHCDVHDALDSYGTPESYGEWAGDHLATYWFTLSPEISEVWEEFVREWESSHPRESPKSEDENGD